MTSHQTRRSAGILDTRAALDDESTGYFLVPAGASPPAGRSQTTTARPSGGKESSWVRRQASQGPQQVSAPAPNLSGMAQYKGTLTVNLHIWDAPVGTPRSDPRWVTVAYNLREQFQPQIPLFELRSQWTFDWFSTRRTIRESQSGRQYLSWRWGLKPTRG